jgi:hypothetical protein
MAAAILAVIIYVISSLSPMKGGRSTSEEATRSRAAAARVALLSQAQVAQDSGDTTTAAELAARAYALDPTDTTAKALLASIERQKKQEAADATSASGLEEGSAATDGKRTAGGSIKTEGPWDEGWKVSVASVSAQLPAKFEGWLMGSVVDDRTDPSVFAEPKSRSAQATRITWSVHESSSEKNADQFIRKTSEVLYPKSSFVQEVDGAPVYFGTDGARYATVAYVRGRYVFEVLLSAADGVKPGVLGDLAIDAAGAFPDSPHTK